MLRRWLAPVVVLLLVSLLAWAAGRFLPRSPLVILLVCVLAVVVMKLVERQVRLWFVRWEERERRRVGRGSG
jgi:hypothetical protein